MFKAKLNFKFYLVALVFLGVVVLGWYGIYFLQTHEILMENGEPMESTTRIVFLVLGLLIVLSWTFSFLTVFRLSIAVLVFIRSEAE